MNEKIKLRIFQFLLVGLISILFYSCSKISGRVPKLTTSDISSIKLDSASCGGTIISDERRDIITRGVCWSVNNNPTIADNKTVDGSGKGSFESVITGLIPNTVYYVRAYATNSSKEGTGYGNTVTFKTEPLAIGSYYQGGIVAYFLKAGDMGYDSTKVHGIIASPTDQSRSIQWNNGSFIVTGASGTIIGTGNSNSNAIFNTQGTGSYAAELCSNLVLNGFSDWYLPSEDELNELYKNKVNIGGFANMIYWSSSEYDNVCAWYENFGNGFLRTNDNKYTSKCVRAVRSF